MEEFALLVFELFFEALVSLPWQRLLSQRTKSLMAILFGALTLGGLIGLMSLSLSATSLLRNSALRVANLLLGPALAALVAVKTSGRPPEGEASRRKERAVFGYFFVLAFAGLRFLLAR